MSSVKPAARRQPVASAAALAPAGAPHLAVLGLLVGLLLLGFAGSLALLAHSAADPARTGRFTVLFPPGSSAEVRFAAVLAAGTLPIRESWLPGTIEVEGEAPEVAARLRARGALLVLPALPSRLSALGGCSGGRLEDFPDRPALRKLHAGPL
jgi:hypothetical protein